VPAPPSSLAVRKRTKRPGAATLGWLLVAVSLYAAAFAAADAIRLPDAPRLPAAQVVLEVAIAFAAFVLGWRMARERRPVGPTVWLSRLLNIPGFVESVRSSRPVRRAPSAMRDSERARRETRNALRGVAVGIVWIGVAMVVVRLGIVSVPPLSSALALAITGSVATLAGAVLPNALARRRATKPRVR